MLSNKLEIKKSEPRENKNPDYPNNIIANSELSAFHIPGTVLVLYIC